MHVRELAEWLGATFEGDGEKPLLGAAPLETAGADDLAFVATAKAVRQAESSAAGCLIVPADYANAGGRTVIRAAEPRTAFVRAVARLHPAPPLRPGIHPSALIEPGAEIPADVEVGAMCWIGESTRVGSGTRIGPGASIGRRVTIGAGSLLHANVTIYDDVEIGARAVLHSGCVIGADGFGFALAGGRYEKFPQIGRVEVGDDVEIGANSCVDRAALGVTWIGEGTKLDNMVHVAHNCRIGKHVVIAAQTGIAGESVVEDYAVIGGQVGIADKVRIESRAVLGAQCGVPSSKIIRAGQVVWGTPARPIKEYLESLAALGRIPELRRKVDELRARLEELEGARVADRGRGD